MEMDKQTFGYLFGALVIIFLWLKFRNPYSGSKDRRKEQRRVGMKDRRVDKGRRKANQLQHESKLPERRHERAERRQGEKTRRHKRRRKDDKVH
jgi:hypothetical protein